MRDSVLAGKTQPKYPEIWARHVALWSQSRLRRTCQETREFDSQSMFPKSPCSSNNPLASPRTVRRWLQGQPDHDGEQPQLPEYGDGDGQIPLRDVQA